MLGDEDHVKRIAGANSTAPEFTAIAAAYDRCFWLDGAATRPWSGPTWFLPG